jgi:uncharacterized membrane protein (DUF2068 family)
MNKSQYRTILLFSLSLGLAGAFLDFAIPSLVPIVVLKAMMEHDAAMSTTRLYIGLLLIFAGVGLSLIAMYGLYRFRRWAPRLAVVGTVISLLALPVFNFTSQSGFASALISISSILWGAVVVLCFVEPYRTWFKVEAVVTFNQES